MPVIEPTTAYLDLRWNQARRTPGVHVSQVIRPIAVAMGVFDDGDDEYASLEDRIRLQSPSQAAADSKLLRISCGLAWEEWYGHMLETCPLYPGFVYHPGEYEAPATVRADVRDATSPASFSMLGTPDGISESQLPACPLSVHEIKYTYKSDKHEPTHYWHHICQLSTYCHLLSVACGFPVLDAYLHMIHVRGNYRDIFPTLRVYRITFTAAEIAANWLMLSTEARILLDSGALVPEGISETATTTPPAPVIPIS